ncbi:MAG: competence/damage-inducible protein A [Bacteroidia bacterium]|nr:competence/damage-inducible protein A [Bacteroidia bacterium]
MNAVIITIGDELLIGQVIDSNSAWMGKKLNEIGISVSKKYCIADDKNEIIETLDESSKKAEIVLITGGLGPTKDDITKNTLAQYFKTQLVLNKDAQNNVEAIFAKSKRTVQELNREQAMLPESCTPIANPRGTAFGMAFEQNGKVFYSIPGVPFEMKGMMSEVILPELAKKFNSSVVFHKTVLTQGVGESSLAVEIEDWENNLPSHIKLAYLPKPGMVRLRLSTKAKNHIIKDEIENEIDKLKAIIGNLIFGYDEDTMEEVVGRQLKAQSKTMATAESCTGGNIARMITAVPGSSNYFKGSVVSYANEVKQDLLNVKQEDLQKVGAVSEEVITSMVLGVKDLLKTDYAIASSGIAGPDGGSEEKPVGTVWLAVAGPNGVRAKKYQFIHNRARNIEISSLTALNMLRKELISKA